MSTAAGVDFDAIAEAISPDQLARAIGAEKVQGGYRCPSPDHDDTNPSFSTFRDGSRTAARCHGCDLRGSPVTVASRVWGVEAPEAAERLGREIGLVTVATLDPDRQLHLRGLRPETIKRFGIEAVKSRRAWRFPVDAPGFWRLKSWNGEAPKFAWEPAKPPEGAHVYGLPLLEGQRDALLVEGEPDTWICHQTGLPAITFTCGAGTVPEAGVRAIVEAGIQRAAIIYDHDEAGRKGSIKAARALRDAGLAVEVRRLPPDMPPGSDLTDLYNLLERDDEAFRRAVKELDVVEGEEDALPVPVRALEAEAPPPPEFLVDDFLLKAETGLVVGDGGTFKTTGLLHIGAAVAGGYPVFGSRVFRTAGAPVLYISEEDGLGVLLNRLGALIRGHGWDRERVLGNLYLLAQEGVSLDEDLWRDHLADHVEDLGIRLVVFDPYAELTLAKENANDEVKPLVRFWRRLNTDLGATVLVSHHAGKVTEGKRKLDRVRGASALNAAARFIYFLDTAELGFSVECLKLSRAERPEKFVVRTEIEADPDNRASWTSARLSYVSEYVAEDMVAERFILEALTGEPGPKSTELKELAGNAGLNPREVSEALSALHERREVDFQAGKFGAKHWYLTGAASPPNATPQKGLQGLHTQPPEESAGGKVLPVRGDRTPDAGQGGDMQPLLDFDDEDDLPPPSEGAV